MNERIKPKPKRSINVVYGDVQIADAIEVEYPIGPLEQIPVFNEEKQQDECDPEDQKHITD